LKTLGPKFGAQLKDVIVAIAAADASELAVKVREGHSILLRPFDWLLEPGDLLVSVKAAEGWAGIVAGETQIALDTRISEELAGEGMARDVIRQVQDQRREAGLEMEDRIVLYLGTESEKLRAAIEAHLKYIAGETLTIEWSSQPLTGPDVHRATVKVDGQPLTMELKKAVTK
jgi:isoleucyl-tRNA synthetase